MSAFETEARGAGKLSAEAEEGIYSHKGDDEFDDDGLPKRTGVVQALPCLPVCFDIVRD